MPAAVSVRTSPSSTMRPRSGRMRPAITLTSDVLPAPERPHSAVTPPPLSNAASRRKSPSECSIAALNMSQPKHPSAGTLNQGLGSKQRQHRDCDRDECQSERREIAARLLDEKIDRSGNG